MATPDPTGAVDAYSGANGSNIDTSTDWHAWWGTNWNRNPDPKAWAPASQSEQTSSMSQTAMANYLYTQWNLPNMAGAEFRARMIRLGIATGSGSDYDSIAKMWNDAGAYSALLWSNGEGSRATPLEILEMKAGVNAGGTGGYGIGRGSPSSGSTSKSSSSDTSYDISNAATAKALTNAVLTAALGREATPQELASYKAALNAGERAAPGRRSSSSTTASDGSGNGTSTSSSTSQSGGLDSSGKAQILLDKARGTVEGQAFRTQDTFEKAMSVLAGRIG